LRIQGYFGLAVASLAFALSFLPAPVAVLYELNDQSLRAATLGARSADWTTIHRVPPTPIARHYYLSARAAVLIAVVGSVFLLVTAVVTFRSRAWSIRLHGVYVAAQVVLMIALLITARQFTVAMEASAPHRDWMVRLPAETSVYSLAKAVAGFGLLYPLVLVILFVRRGRLTRRRV
jgi:hypothetical protein